jgi:acetyl-CoA acetyltransferase
VGSSRASDVDTTGGAAIVRPVSVVGAGMVAFGRQPQRSLAALARPAVRSALADAGIGPSEVEVATCGNVFGGMLAGQRVLKDVGLTGIPVLNAENACASGSTALHVAWLMVASGRHDLALVIGVEKLTELGGGPLPLQADDWEVANGMVMPALYAMRAQRYLALHGATAADLAAVVVKSREHGACNPYAQLRAPTTVDDVLGSPPVAEPLTRDQCCPTGDGAAALVLMADGTARETAPRRQPVRILASAVLSGRHHPGPQELATSDTTARCAGMAYEMAGLGPEDVDVAEIHDAFSIAELMSYEALGWCEPGDGARLLHDGVTSLGGRLPVNPSGGLLSRGHPLGATGVAQAVEIVWQLRHAAGDRQVEGARVGLTHTTGGGISGLDHGACSVHIFSA